MTLRFHYHPLSSFCHKALIALYENDTPFEPVLVELFKEDSAAPFKKMWPIGKIPVLRDEARDRTIPETSIIIEYLAQYFPGRTRLIPADADRARQTRLADRFYDLYVHAPMQKVITDRLRPAGQNDAYGVEDARRMLRTAYGMVEAEMAGKQWAMGDDFTMADCAAAPALFYAEMAEPFAQTHKNVAAYRERLMARPSYARALKEAEPYFAMIPR